MQQKDFSNLLSIAKQIECNSYSPLSNRSNGVALLCENGEIYVAITGDNVDINYLCGDCRQAYAEFGTDLVVISELYPEDYKVLSELLPQVESR